MLRRWAAGVAVLAAVASVPALATPGLAESVRSEQMWVLTTMHVPAAWRVTQGQGVVVAVIDSGVNPNVSDLRGSVQTGPDYTGSPRTSPANPDWGVHGTWMASLIAGHGHGKGGILGVAPRAAILSIRVLADKGDPAYSRLLRERGSVAQAHLARAIAYAIAHHANVISLSLGNDAASRAVRLALQRALDDGIVVVASAGNSGNTSLSRKRGQAPYSFPADYPGVLGVAAVRRDGAPAWFSSENLSVQVAAPGVDVPAQGRDGQYWLVTGTSPACALTAGVAALIKARYPKLPSAMVLRAITTTARSGPRAGYDDRVGFGIVDAAAALTAAGRLSRFAGSGQGAAAAAHFGGGAAAVPPVPVPPRSRRALAVWLLLALASLLFTATVAARLARGRGRRPATGVGAPPPIPGPRW